jgi:hypothetical protein
MPFEAGKATMTQSHLYLDLESVELPGGFWLSLLLHT